MNIRTKGKTMKNFLVCMAVLCLTGCVNRIGDFTVASTKNIDIKRTLHVVDSTRRVRGIDRKHMILFIPLGIPNIKEAMDNAEEKAPKCVGLSDVTLKAGWFYIPYVYGQFWYDVEGNPVFEAQDGIPENFIEKTKKTTPKQQYRHTGRR